MGNRWFTLSSLLCLLTGLGAGIALHGSQAGWVAWLAGWIAPLGGIWARVLNLLAIPLIISVAVVAALDTPGMGRLGRRAVGWFAALLGGGALLALLVGPPLVALLSADPASAALLRAGITVPEAARGAAGAVPGWAAWLRNYLPASFDAVFRGAQVLVLLLGAVLLALLLRRFGGRALPGLRLGFRRVAAAIQLLVRGLLLVSPLAILGLSFQLGLSAGGRAAGFLAGYVLIVAGVLLLATALLYPLTALLGRVSLARFARAAAPAQLVAVSTQSSLAALPALIEGGRRELGLSDGATGLVLPLSVAVFKLNRTISGPVQLLLLTHAFGVPLSLPRLLLFLAAAFLQSVFTPGVPGGGNPYFTLPLYVAAGAPIEGVVLVSTVEPLVDVFKTLTNVTADLAAATIVGARDNPRAA